MLVVDDDPELLPLVAFALRREGYFVLEAATGEAALATVTSERPDLVVLDVNLPGIDGFEVCRRIRRGGDSTPVLMLTVRGDELDEVTGLDAGADDYLTKPFSPRTLLARVRALLRRAGHERARRVTAGAVELDAELHVLHITGKSPVRLTPLEFRLLQLLVMQGGRAVRSERILLHVWGTHGAADRQLLKQLVHRLRQKIEEDPSTPQRLLAVPGLGYRWESAPSEKTERPPGEDSPAPE